MFEDKAAPAFEGEEPGARVRGTGANFIFRGLPVHDLIKYRDEINALLPAMRLSEMNLEEEMLLQFHSTRSLQNDVIADEEVPANQRAQVANAVASALSKLADLQEQIYTSERMKQIERMLIEQLVLLPEATVQAFMDGYQIALERKFG
jgi:hypothetical protein